MKPQRFFVPSKNRYYNIPERVQANFLRDNPDAVPVDAAGEPVSVALPSPTAPATPAAAPTAAAGRASPEAESTLGGALGGIVRGAGPIAGGAMLGAALGAPVGGIGALPGAAGGAASAAIAQLLADPAMGFINYAAGTDFPMPSKTFTDFLTQMGVPEPDTAAERLVQQFAGGAAGAMAGVGAGRMLMGPAMGVAPTTAQRVGQAMASQPATQAAAGAVGGLAGQAAAEAGAPVPVQLLAGLAGGAGAGAGMSRVSPAPPTMTPMPKPSPKAEALERYAVRQRLSEAGPKFTESIEAGLLRGVDKAEADRVARALGVTGFRTPGGIFKRAKEERNKAGSIISRIYEDVDAQAGGFMERAQMARADAEAKLSALAPERANRIKAAEDARKKADEIEKAVADVGRRLEEQRAELRRTGSGVGEPRQLPSKAAEEPGVLITTGSFQERVRKDLQKAAQEAADGVSKKLEAAKQAEVTAVEAEAAAEAERQAIATELSPAKRRVAEPMLGRMMDPSKTASFAARKAKEDAAVAARDAAVALQQFRQTYAITQAGPPAPSSSVQVPMRALVSGRRFVEAQQKELDMMTAAAKKAREEADAADDALKSLETVGEKQARDSIRQAEQLESLAANRRVSGKAVASALRSQANEILASHERQNPGELLGAAQRKTVDALNKEAAKAEAGGDMSLTAAFKTIDSLRSESKWDKVPSGGRLEVVTAQAEAARAGTRALQSEMERAAEEGLSPLSDIFEQEIARIGRGEPIKTPSGAAALGSARRSYAVMKPMSESAKEEAARISRLPMRPGWMSKEGFTSMIPESPWLSGQLGPAAAEVKARAAEAGASLLRPGSSVPASQQIASGLGAQSYLELLDAIEKSYEPEDEAAQMSMEVMQ